MLVPKSSNSFTAILTKPQVLQGAASASSANCPVDIAAIAQVRRCVVRGWRPCRTDRGPGEGVDDLRSGGFESECIPSGSRSRPFFPPVLSLKEDLKSQRQSDRIEVIFSFTSDLVKSAY